MKKNKLKKIVSEQHEIIDGLSTKLRDTLLENEKLRARLSTITDSPDIQEFTSDDVAVVHAEVKQFGTYVALSEPEWTDERVENAKVALTEELVEGLLRNDLVQFIVKAPKESDTPLASYTGTVAGKLMVIPWECGYRRVEDLHPVVDYTKVCEQPRDEKGRFTKKE